MAIMVLDSLGHSGFVVDDGQKALSCLAQRQFDLVLMDVMMPVMDGLQALAAIHKKEQQFGTRQAIVMVSSHAEPRDKIRSM